MIEDVVLVDFKYLSTMQFVEMRMWMEENDIKYKFIKLIENECTCMLVAEEDAIIVKLKFNL